VATKTPPESPWTRRHFLPRQEHCRWQAHTSSRHFRKTPCLLLGEKRVAADGEESACGPDEIKRRDTGQEWAFVEPLIPPGKRGGGKRRVDMREVVNGVMYILSTGCQWRYLPRDLPPKSTVHDYLGLWNWDGTLDRIHHALYVQCREQAEREASPTACIIDSQSVKSAEKGGPASIATASMRAS
jgi:transposase